MKSGRSKRSDAHLVRSFIESAGRGNRKELATFFDESIDDSIYSLLNNYKARPTRFSMYRWTTFLGSLTNDLAVLLDHLREANDLRAAWIRRELDYCLFLQTLPLVRQIEGASFNQDIAAALESGNSKARDEFVSSNDKLGKGFGALSLGVRNAQKLIKTDQGALKEGTQEVTNMVEAYQRALQSRFTEEGGPLNFHERYLRQRAAILDLAPSVYERAWAIRDMAQYVMTKNVRALPVVSPGPGYFDSLEMWLRSVLEFLSEELKNNSSTTKVAWARNFEDIAAANVDLSDEWEFKEVSERSIVKTCRLVLTPWGEETKQSYVMLPGGHLTGPKKLDAFNPGKGAMRQSGAPVPHIPLSLERGTIVVDLTDQFQNTIMDPDTKGTRSWGFRFDRPTPVAKPSKIGLRLSFELELVRTPPADMPS